MTNSGVSLNDKLKVGPTIQQELVNILIRFRQHSIVITSDVEKMYRQVNIKLQHQDLQRILWRAEPEHDIAHYNLTTVTYGTASAPFLAIRCLHEVFNLCEKTHPVASQVIRRDFYVDDLITGASSTQEARQLKQDL
nr:unnamed protein product [Callosobruchus analis]